MLGTRGVRSAALAAAVVALTACASAPAPPPAPASVALSFDWPLGTVARASTERSRRTRDGEASESQTVRVTYAVDVAEDPRGRLVRFHDFAASDPATGRAVTLDGANAASAFVVALSPTYLVEPSGHLAGLEDLPSGFPPDAVEALATSFWNQLVGGWAGRELIPGTPGFADDTLVLPIFGGTRVPVEVRVVLLGRVPCSDGSGAPAADGDAPAACVALELVREPDAVRMEVIRSGIAEHEAMLGDALDERVADLAVREELYLVTEPGTLLPRYLEVTRRFELRLRDAAGAERQVEVLDQRVDRWEPAAAAQ